MDLSQFKDNNNISVEYINIFFENYPLFDIIFYTKVLYKLNINYTNILDHYHNYGVKNNILYSIKHFYNLYPSFDILFFKNIYYNENYNNDIEYLIDYHESLKKKEYKFDSLKYFEEFHKLDFQFLEIFYDNFKLKKKLNIIKELLINIEEYILSEEDFDKKFPNFSIKIIKNYDSNLIFENNILYKKYWYFNQRNCVSCLDDIIKKYNFNIILYKNIYNLEFETDEDIVLNWINYKDMNIIYSVQTFYTNIDDFNYYLFIKHFPNVKLYSKIEIINFYLSNIEKINYIYSIKLFYIKFPDFNLEKYKLDNNININFEFNIINEYFQCIKKKYDNIKLDLEFNRNIYLYYINNLKDCNIDIIYSIKSFYKIYNSFNKDIYLLINNLYNYSEEELIIHFLNNGLKEKLPYNEYTIPEFSLKLYKELNLDLIDLDNYNLVLHWYTKGREQDRIYSISSFLEKYPIIKLNNEDEIIDWMKNGVYKENNNLVGRSIVNNIYEVLIDLSNPLPKNNLENGISLIIRAKNEESNIDLCIKSVIDLVDEIIFIDNNSTDNTYELVKKYTYKYDKIKLYQYNINVNKVGIDHKEALKNNNKNTLGTFYNWCLSKSTKNNVFKWDADFICIQNNFIQLVEIYNLKKREDKFAIWFTGITLFENNNNYYLNPNSYYNEFRIFSFKNNFSWYDGEICEYTEPYLVTCNANKKFKYEFPLFYELKRTSLDEFQERSSLIDNRDINDLNILNKLKENNNINLIPINERIIYDSKKIIIYTPSLNFGGGNQFIINMYKVLKYIGYNIKIFPNSINKRSNKFNIIINDDIKEGLTIAYIKEFKPDIIIFNSDIPFDETEILLINKFTKIIFITHSDVAYSNYFITKYHLYFYRILTVNNYTINKLINNLNIEKSKFFKIINYVDLKLKKKVTKNYTFGVISRFSEDKNIPMFLLSLVKIFKKYPKYKCYLVGTDSDYYDEYLKYLCKINNIENNIIFTGFQEDVGYYYQLFDFIVLPSVSEGCSYNLIEAMGLGLPIICSNVGGNHELIENDKNGIIYNYSGIKEFESKNIYIKNYNEQLASIGYIIKDNLYNYNFDVNAYVPQYTLCKNNMSNFNKNCSYCTHIKQKMEIFNLNLNNIYESIIKMIELDSYRINAIERNNIDFINNNYNQEIYINQLLNYLNYI